MCIRDRNTRFKKTFNINGSSVDSQETDLLTAKLRSSKVTNTGALNFKSETETSDKMKTEKPNKGKRLSKSVLEADPNMKSSLVIVGENSQKGSNKLQKSQRTSKKADGSAKYTMGKSGKSSRKHKRSHSYKDMSGK